MASSWLCGSFTSLLAFRNCCHALLMFVDNACKGRGAAHMCWLCALERDEHHAGAGTVRGTAYVAEPWVVLDKWFSQVQPSFRSVGLCACIVMAPLREATVDTGSSHMPTCVRLWRRSRCNTEHLGALRSGATQGEACAPWPTRCVHSSLLMLRCSLARWCSACYNGSCRQTRLWELSDVLVTMCTPRAWIWYASAG